MNSARRAATLAPEQADVVLFADTFNNYFESENAHGGAAGAGSGRLQGARGAPRRGRRATGPPAVLRAHLPRQRPGRPGQGRSAPRGRSDAPVRRARRAGGRPGAILPADAARRIPRHGPGRGRRSARRAGLPVRRIPRPRARRRPPEPAAASAAGQQRAAARPLPPESVRRGAAGAGGAGPDSGPEGRADRIELLRHGRQLRLRSGALRRVDADGRTVAAAGGARGGGRHAAGGRRHQLPAPDRRRHARRRRPARGGARGARAGAALARSLQRSVRS